MRFSIVTTSFNSGDYIGEALQSVLEQAGVGEVEHVVADAESTDQTEQVLASFPHLKLDRRKDRGIYDGMNRAIGLATGDVIGIVNADDRLPPGALAEIQTVFESREADIATGAFQLMGPDGRIGPSTFAPAGPPNYRGLLFGVSALNTRFFRRDVFKRVGLFDLAFPLAADRVWLLRAVQAGLRFAATPKPVYVYRQHPGSATLAGDRKTSERLWRSHLEMADILLADAGGDREFTEALRTWRALEAMKLRVAHVAGWTSRAEGQSRPAAGWDLARCLLGEPVRTVSALTAWRRLRGMHSDGRS